MKDRNYRLFGETDGSDLVMNSTFWIGLFPGLTTAHLDFVIETIKAFCHMGGR